MEYFLVSEAIKFEDYFFRIKLRSNGIQLII